jgi:K(+)-stimulated pyrophosphate-energized sodium pump
MAAVGYISNIGTMASISSFSTVVDNAKKIATMADLDNHVRETTSALDAVGHTSSAIVKGFATGSSVLTAVALVAAFKKKTGLTVVDLNDAYVTSCLLFGAMIPYVFSALTMLSVHKVLFTLLRSNSQFHQMFQITPLLSSLYII